KRTPCNAEAFSARTRHHGVRRLRHTPARHRAPQRRSTEAATERRAAGRAYLYDTLRLIRGAPRQPDPARSGGSLQPDQCRGRSLADDDFEPCGDAAEALLVEFL